MSSLLQRLAPDLLKLLCKSAGQTVSGTKGELATKLLTRPAGDKKVKTLHASWGRTGLELWLNGKPLLLGKAATVFGYADLVNVALTSDLVKCIHHVCIQH